MILISIKTDALFLKVIIVKMVNIDHIFTANALVNDKCSIIESERSSDEGNAMRSTRRSSHS